MNSIKKIFLSFSLLILIVLFQNCSGSFDSAKLQGELASSPTTSDEQPSQPSNDNPSDPINNSNTLPLGTVIEKIGATCSAGSIPNTSCIVYTVSGPELNPIDVNIRITQPAMNVPLKGTVVFGTGGSGTGFIDSGASMRTYISQLAGSGYLVIQRAWLSTWTKSDVGMAKAASRYSTLLKYLHTNYFTSGAFCAGGNSAGGSEISYALARYGLGNILDFAIVSGGPPMGRLDLGCLGGDGWTGVCSNVVPRENFVYSQALDCNVGEANFTLIDGAYGQTRACSLKVESQRTLLYEDSLASTLSNFNYPNTKIHFIYGQEDFTFAAPSGHTYSLQVTSEKEFSYLAGVTHGVPESSTGALAYHDSIIANCVK
ncbi:MAG: hypothetical protein B7Y39_18095 [Bdellovibrio sp. 28-41-41]|nr:MAG: hypothetical protein B7Y39_18095 [Bdellovibrio sp. 28-41-41]